MSAAALAIVGDYVPFGISQSLGHRAGGNSLDNTLRVASRVPTDWILADIRVHAIAARLRPRPRAPLGPGRHAARHRQPVHDRARLARRPRARPRTRRDRRRRRREMTQQRWGITVPFAGVPLQRAPASGSRSSSISASPTSGRARPARTTRSPSLALAAAWTPDAAPRPGRRPRLHAWPGAARADDREPRRRRARTRRASASARRRT